METYKKVESYKKKSGVTKKKLKFVVRYHIQYYNVMATTNITNLLRTRFYAYHSSLEASTGTKAENLNNCHNELPPNKRKCTAYDTESPPESESGHALHCLSAILVSKHLPQSSKISSLAISWFRLFIIHLQRLLNGLFNVLKHVLKIEPCISHHLVYKNLLSELLLIFPNFCQGLVGCWLFVSRDSA